MSLIIDILKFVVPFWLINISLNGIYVAKLRSDFVARNDKPIDMGMKFFDGFRILGNSTTTIGFFVAIIAGIIIHLVTGNDVTTSIEWGIIFGLLVYFGHALGSFIKRRFKYDDGKFMPFVDHGDYIVLAGMALGLVQKFSWRIIFLGIILTYIVHPIFTYGAYLLKLHKKPL